ncbi:MAG: XdhC family protein, partial [candidate division KSB1 bacterium]|nr:XdhC family protein [candidate division KSB1 bacterium]
YLQLLNELKKDSPIALATILETKGSTPQIPGASALFSAVGLVTGTLGGGLLEAEAQKRALQSLQQKTSLLYKFDLTADLSSEQGAICGGEVTILIDTRPEKHTKTFQRIYQSLSQRQLGVLATVISKHSEERISITRHWIEKREDFETDSEIPLGSFQEEIKESLTENKPSLLKVQENLLFLEPIFPLPQLIIAGAGHIGQAVAHLGSLLDFEVTVIDDRPEFANKERFPEADHILVDDIGKAMQGTPISSDTYIVIVTRGHKNDADALRQCINSEAAYIGMIGSARKIELMRKKFLEEGWATSTQFDRVYAPIGIDIQSKTVQEIAVSIAAQLILVRRQKEKYLARPCHN